MADIKYKFLDLKKINLEYKKEFHEALDQVLDSGYYLRGQATEKFEEEFARYCGAKYCVAVGNGLDALTLVLKAWGVGPGDEVIVPSNTFIATWLAVTNVGATIVPVDPNWDTYNIEASAVEEKITKKTKVIIPVHLYGQPVELDPIIDLAKKHDLKILEDGAQAHGGTYKNKKIGSHGNPVAFSFYPGKNLGGLGDSGAVITDDFHLADKVRAIANYGSKEKYIHEYLGVNSRMDELQAMFLSLKLKNIDRDNQIRKNIAKVYLKNISSQNIVLPQNINDSDSVWHLFVIRNKSRDQLKSYAYKNGVECLVHYPIPAFDQVAYKYTLPSEGLANKMANQILSLPIGPHLDENNAVKISSIINSFS